MAADVLAGRAAWEVEQGDARAGLAALPEASVHLVVCSPPYWSLRLYPTAAWLGGEPACRHRPRREQHVESSGLHGSLANVGHALEPVGDVCPWCGAVKHDDLGIGTEKVADCLAWARGEPPCPEPSCYLCHLRTVFGGRDRPEGIYRVLRDDGLLVLNIGDGYSANSAVRERGARSVMAALEGREKLPIWREHARDGAVKRVGSLPAKNLMLIPERLALALQADGWIIRSVVPWLKRNVLPESVGDRPVTAHEYIIVASKQAAYYWDGLATALPLAGDSAGRYLYGFAGKAAEEADNGERRTRVRGSRATPTTRSYRTSDPFRAQFDAEISATLARLHALRRIQDGEDPVLDEDGMVAALWLASQPSDYDYCDACGRLFEGDARREIKITRVPNPKHKPMPGVSATAGQKALTERGDRNGPFLSVTRTCPCGRDDAWTAHFAAFPASLVEPFIKAGCPERACAACGAGHVRVIEKKVHYQRKNPEVVASGTRGWGTVRGDGDRRRASIATATLGWRPSCSCGMPAETRSGVVLDPFCGSGTVGLVATRLGRHFVGLELAPSYVRLAEARLRAPHTPPAEGVRQGVLWADDKDGQPGRRDLCR